MRCRRVTKSGIGFLPVCGVVHASWKHLCHLSVMVRKLSHQTDIAMTSERSIRNSQSQLLNMLDSIAEGIYCVDLNGACTYCNARCLELLGYSSEDELLGNNMHDLIHYQHRDGSEYNMENCKIFLAIDDDQHVHVDDEVFWRKDGRRFDAEYWSFPIKEDGKIVGAVVSFVDITLKRAEAAHRNQLARLVETSLDAIISKDANGCHHQLESRSKNRFTVTMPKRRSVKVQA